MKKISKNILETLITKWWLRKLEKPSRLRMFLTQGLNICSFCYENGVCFCNFRLIIVIKNFVLLSPATSALFKKPFLIIRNKNPTSSQFDNLILFCLVDSHPFASELFGLICKTFSFLLPPPRSSKGEPNLLRGQYLRKSDFLRDSIKWSLLYLSICA